MIAYEIKLPRDQDPDPFIEFMRDEYIPAVHKGPTRTGQVADVHLLQSRTAGGVEFLLLVGFDGIPTVQIRVDNEEVLRKLESFQVVMKPLGCFQEVAEWKKTVPG